jgi:hypothetical protein
MSSPQIAGISCNCRDVIASRRVKHGTTTPESGEALPGFE